MNATKPVEALTEAEAQDELARLAELLGNANSAYHTDDDPVMSDGDYDALKADLTRWAQPELPCVSMARRRAGARSAHADDHAAA